MTENTTRAARPFTRARTVPPWSLLAAGVVAGGLLGGAYGVLTPADYTATSYVIAVPTDRSDTATAQGFAQAYGRVATQLGSMLGTDTVFLDRVDNEARRAYLERIERS